MINSDWEHLICSLPSRTGYSLMNQHERYVFLKQRIEKLNLPEDQYQQAIISLCDFLNY